MTLWELAESWKSKLIHKSDLECAGELRQWAREKAKELIEEESYSSRHFNLDGTVPFEVVMNMLGIPEEAE